MGRRIQAALLALAGALTAPAHAQGTTTGIGVISYWGTDTALYDQLPAGSLAVINPDSGIFTGQTSTLVADLPVWRALVDRTASRGVRLLGYVPTGYFSHGCNVAGQCQTWTRIEAQVAAYFAQLPSISGIFFDEAAPAAWSCSAFVTEYQRLRALVAKYRPGAQITFNAGVPDNCVVDGAQAGETVVLFESSGSDYTAQSAEITASTAAARAKGVQTWHLAHSVTTQGAMSALLTSARQMQVNRVYVTNIGGNWQAGENTWGSLPVYWASEVRLLTGPLAAIGLNWGTVTRQLVNSGSLQCLRGSSGRLDQQPCAGTGRWSLGLQRVAGLPYYQLRYGTQCAAQPSPDSTALSWAPCSASAASQMWAMRPVAGGLFHLENRQSAQVLSLPGTAAGTTAVAENYSAAPHQLFQFQ